MMKVLWVGQREGLGSLADPIWLVDAATVSAFYVNYKIILLIFVHYSHELPEDLGVVAMKYRTVITCTLHPFVGPCR